MSISKVPPLKSPHFQTAVRDPSRMSPIQNTYNRKL